jgi:hypothetical protein
LLIVQRLNSTSTSTPAPTNILNIFWLFYMYLTSQQPLI